MSDQRLLLYVLRATSELWSRTVEQNGNGSSQMILDRQVVLVMSLAQLDAEHSSRKVQLEQEIAATSRAVLCGNERIYCIN